MDVQIFIENADKTFLSGEVVLGKVQISCAQPTTVSKLTTSLFGESTSSLTGAPGLLFSRKEDERHTLLCEELRIIPSPLSSKPGNIRLGAGCHIFDFRLRVPWFQECHSCPPNSPVEGSHEHEIAWNISSPEQQLPPSMIEFQKGTGITYRIDVAVTTIRNMFKSRTVKTSPITIWPVDAQLANRCSKLTACAAKATARATILGQRSLRLRSDFSADDVHVPTPAEILISANFQPEFRLVKNSPTTPQSPNHREIAMGVTITKLNHHPQDLYLQSFQMLLIGYTDIRAGTATHGHMTFWSLKSLSNIGLLVFTASDDSGTQHDIDSRLWNDVTLDETVVPDFATCNFGRRYELEVLMGWQCMSGEHAGRVFFVQVRTPVRITSGILFGNHLEEGFSSKSKRDVQGIPNCDQQYLRNDELGLRGAPNELPEPPTYDEAVRAAVKNGLEAFELRKAGV